MLYFNVKRLLRLRGTEKHYKTLVNMGFTHFTAKNLLSRELRQCRLDTIEKLCILLNCTPNDLLEWRPEADTVVPESHALNSLKPRSDKDITELFNQLPVAKFEQILDILSKPE